MEERTEEGMYCKRCRIKMREEKRLFHKQRKWICPKCGRVRFEGAGDKRNPKDKVGKG